MHVSRSRYLPLLIVGSAVILFSTAGIAAIMGWLPATAGDSGDILARGNVPAALAARDALTVQTAPAPAPGGTRVKARCPECGVIVSMREIDAGGAGTGLAGVTAAGNKALSTESARRYEITVRLADGSRRVIEQANPASWRQGERLILIDGAPPSNR
ncbi:MAG: hypothetical protein ACT4P8_09550 [Betaproteobacteria bacterium]